MLHALAIPGHKCAAFFIGVLLLLLAVGCCLIYLILIEIECAVCVFFAVRPYDCMHFGGISHYAKLHYRKMPTHTHTFETHWKRTAR